VVRGSGYMIVVMVEFILIASASFAAPTSPILLYSNLIDERGERRNRERGEKRKGGQGQWLLDIGDGGVHHDRLGQLRRSDITNIIILQPDR
jgi:hypothetical protein